MERPPYSYLFVPGNRPERFAKACACGAGAVIIDLEDAVPDAQKVEARAAITRWLSPEHPALVRINGVETEWFQGDLALLGRPGIAALVLPKAESAGHIQNIREQIGETVPVLPMIETAQGFWNALEIARSPGVRRLLFGSIDLQLDLGMRGDGDLLYFRSKLVLLSRIAGIDAPVDGITSAINDIEQLRADTLRGRRLGFGGKLCIHPKQVACVNGCFRPTPEEIAWAKGVLEAASLARGAAVAVDGEMADRPSVLKANRILRESGVIPNSFPFGTLE